MDPVTDNPVPEPGVFERFLEQIGVWLDAIPSVPHWVQWIAVVVGIGVPIVTIVWVRWGANWRAAGSPNAAENRAKKLFKRVVEMHALSRNPPAMLFLGVNVVIALIFLSLFVILGFVQLGHVFAPNAFGLPPSDFLIAGRTGMAFFLHAIGIGMMFVFLFLLSRIQPLNDIDRYTERSRTRIEKLLAKAGIPDEVSGVLLGGFDDSVEAARNQEFK